MAARVASPSGEVEDAEISDSDDCLYAVNFTPKETGIHTVSVRHKVRRVLSTMSHFQYDFHCTIGHSHPWLAISIYCR